MEIPRPLCPQCNKNKRTLLSKIRKIDGSCYYSTLCQGCRVLNKHGRKNIHKKQYHKPGRGYIRFKKDHCEDCKFVAAHPCQLDVDHIDANRNNNAITNLRTLCANCHRLKSHTNKDNHNKKWRVA